jgi:hydrogenase/urease accessory protein HupE
MVALTRRAGAHTPGLSRGDYVLTGGRLAVTLVFAAADLHALVPSADPSGKLGDLRALESARGELARSFAHWMDVRQADTACAGAFESMDFDGDGVALHGGFACPDDPAHQRSSMRAADLRVKLSFLSRLPKEHRHLARLSDRGLSREELVGASGTLHFGEEAASQPTPGQWWSLFVMGIAHILTGYDHLLFLLGLVLLGGTRGSLALAVTAFTIAHSITLALSVLGTWVPSERIVEPAIALSIAYVGIENWRERRRAGRWTITFPFGLLHGFGFASALRAVSLPPRGVPLALLSFNLGVEAGQLLALAAILTVLYLLGRLGFAPPQALRFASAGVAATGALWFVVRLAHAL